MTKSMEELMAVSTIGLVEETLSLQRLNDIFNSEKFGLGLILGLILGLGLG